VAITYSAAGALSTDTDSITPAYPATPTAGQLLVLVAASGHPDDPTPSTPSGWTLADSTSGGGGTFGSGTGPRRLTWWVRVATGDEDAPTTAIPSGGTGSVIAGRVHILARSAGTGWRWAVSVGADSTSGTGFSAAGASALTWAAGDTAILGYALASSSASLTAEAVAATGVTVGTVTERADDAVTTGDACRLAVATCAVSSGSGSTAPTVTATLAAASTGVAGVLRIREASAVLDVTAQAVFPPRVLVSATGLAADDTVTATLYRQVGTALTAVRAASAVDVTGQDALLRVDAEQPFGVPVSYVAALTDVAGTTWQVTSDSITTTVTSDVISDAVRGIGAAVTIETWPEKRRDRDATVFRVGGRNVAVSRPRSAAQASVRVRTNTAAAGDDLQELLDGATEGVLLVRKQVSMEGVDNWLAVVSDTEDRRWFDGIRWWQLEVYETEPWPDVLEAAGYTLQDLADNYATLADLAADFSTLLDIALADLGG
jgi:hypothetical protein